jgi:hypothetical protein
MTYVGDCHGNGMRRDWFDAQGVYHSEDFAAVALRLAEKTERMPDGSISVSLGSQWTAVVQTPFTTHDPVVQIARLLARWLSLGKNRDFTLYCDPKWDDWINWIQITVQFGDGEVRQLENREGRPVHDHEGGGGPARCKRDSLMPARTHKPMSKCDRFLGRRRSDGRYSRRSL